ncbi:hypothetical protein HPB52_012017 [Rhipicephalus sanguineus]|uniref:Uncharacterized protein n=1 Tax=Rhipicephalus sanguineus TaxID=34632 RepID=A0A9D4T7S0_RHISA|nr:hypothetical protein HPB52_012017 [Rhipicephalus sanguineus]
MAVCVKTADRHAVSEDAVGLGHAVGANNTGFERSCTWVPDKERCWIMSDLELWNSILVPGQHRTPRARLGCVTYIILDMTTTVLETSVLLHGIRTGAAGVKLLEIKSPSFDKLTAAENTWSRAVASLKNLVHLCICSAYFSAEIAHTLGVYVEQANVLTTLLLVDIKAPGSSAATFLRFVARNRSLKNLSVEGTFLTAQRGHALANVVRKHVTLERLQVRLMIEFYCALVDLTVTQCFLGEEFATAAASKLLAGYRLRKLNIEDNHFPIDALYDMVEALKVNKTLETLAFDMTSTPSEDELSNLFALIQRIGVFSRLRFNWIKSSRIGLR